ncbi:unnamed protein product [Penicillium salamii]|uniref:Rhodanese domain-containing protein n=1 Tax=Penicillium salamii TaxID=1612424 RepID=A0A9W4N4H5_9EURO|nr:unnamed protein product [Penicillium salamii]
MVFTAIRSSFPRFRTMPSSPLHTQSRNVSFSSYLVTPKQLNEALRKNPPGGTKISTSPRVIPLNAAWFMPNDPEGRKGIESFRHSRIPQARFFDLDAIKDPDSPYPHMLPTCETFAEAMSELGIRRDDEIVVYDTAELGIFSAPRVGWTLRVFGHPNVHVLNNYRLWVQEGLPTESGEPAPVEKTKYSVPVYDSRLVISFREMKELALDYGKEGAEEIEILDARSYGRWAGTDPEPRPGLSSGHLPGSKSLPFQELLDPETKAYLSAEDLRKVFEERQVDPNQTIISSCGTGVTASIIETALAVAEHGDPNLRRVYDGSWTGLLSSDLGSLPCSNMSTGRKVFHCAVDETALSTNISEIKKWTTNGAIDLVVPLYTLERLHALKRAGSQVAINAREAVRFLDRVTSGKDHIAADRVILQGPMEQYDRWEEAEKFFLPEFEEEPEAIDDLLNGDPATDPTELADTGSDPKNESDDLSQMLLSKLNFKKDPEAASITSIGTPSGPGSRTSSRSSRTSPECAQHNSNGTKNDKSKSKSNHQRTTSGSVIPTAPSSLRPLLSALLWRLHKGPDAENSTKTCILITNDRGTQVWAQKFGIGVKNILQLRTAIQYEEREYKNRCKYVEKTQTQPQPEPKTLLSYEEESDEDELVFVPRGRGKGPPRGSSRGASRGGSRKTPPKPPPAPVEPTASVDVPTQPIDPDSFSRSLGGAPKPPPADLSTPSTAARGSPGASRRSSNGRRGAARGARGSGRGRGKLWVP